MNIQLEARYFYKNYFHEPLFLSFSLNASEDYYRELKRALRIKRIVDCNFIRVGNAYDGGYVMLDGMSGSRVAYSFGIYNDVSWDLAVAQCGYEVFMYDHTIEALPQQNEHFHFFCEGITGRASCPKTQPLDTLENFILRNHHMDQTDMILKMDVDGAEWDFLESVSSETLARFDQMVFEFHGLCTSTSLEDTARIIHCIKKLSKTHSLVHLHGNNMGIAVKNDIGYFPDAIEATYARTESHAFLEDDDILLPIPLDAPNTPGHPEVSLGYWNRG